MANERGNPITLVQSPDFLVDNQGTIILFHPQTDDAEQWVTDHLPADAQRFCGGVVVEHRFADDILFGIHNDGLSYEVR